MNRPTDKKNALFVVSLIFVAFKVCRIEVGVQVFPSEGTARVRFREGAWMSADRGSLVFLRNEPQAHLLWIIPHFFGKLTIVFKVSDCNSRKRIHSFLS